MIVLTIYSLKYITDFKFVKMLNHKQNYVKKIKYQVCNNFFVLRVPPCRAVEWGGPFTTAFCRALVRARY